MMYYGGTGWLGWIWMGFSIIAFWAIVIVLLVWTVRSFNQDADFKRPPSGR